MKKRPVVFIFPFCFLIKRPICASNKKDISANGQTRAFLEKPDPAFQIISCVSGMCQNIFYAYVYRNDSMALKWKWNGFRKLQEISPEPDINGLVLTGAFLPSRLKSQVGPDPFDMAAPGH